MALVLINKLSEMSGYTEKAIRRKIEDGVFVEGWHYIKAPDGRLHFDTERYHGWVRGEKPALSRGARA